MLCPAFFDAQESLADVRRSVQSLFQLTVGIDGVQLGTLIPEPTWLSRAQRTLKRSRDASTDWENAYPKIASQIVSSFYSYASFFDALSGPLNEESSSTEVLVEMLKESRKRLNAAAESVESSQESMKKVHSEFNKVHQDFRGAMDAALEGLEGNYQEIAKIAGKVGAIEVRLTNLAGDLQSSELAAGKTGVQLAVKVALPVFQSMGSAAGAAVAVPYIGIFIAVVSAGKSIYDAVKQDEEIKRLLDEYRDLMLEQSRAAQGVAAARGVLQIFSNLDEHYIEASQKMPKLTTLWRTESDKISALIDALEAGADPKKLVELNSVEFANSTWQKIAEIADRILASPHFPSAPEGGAFLTLEPDEPGT